MRKKALILLVLIMASLALPRGAAASVTLSVVVHEENGNIVTAAVITNTGTANLSNVEVKITVTGPQSTTQTYIIPSIAPSENHTIIYQYAPTTPGTYNVTVSLPAFNITKSATIQFTPTRINVALGNEIYRILPETNGQFNVTLAFLGTNFTTLESRTITANYVNVTAPTNTRYIEITSVPYPGLKRYIYTVGLSSTDILFPAQLDSSMYKVFNVYIFNKEDYDLLTIYGDGGAIVERVNLSDFTNLVFPAVLGNTYTFELSTNGTVRYTQKVTVTSSMQYIVLYAPNLNGSGNVTGININLQVSYDNATNTMFYNFSAPFPVSGQLTIYVLGSTGLTPVLTYNFTNRTFLNGSYVLPNPKPSLVKVEVLLPNNVFSKSILPQSTSSSRPFSDELLPNGLMIIIIAAIGLFALVRENIELSAAITAFNLTAATSLGYITFPKAHLVIVYALASSMFLFTRIRGKD